MNTDTLIPALAAIEKAGGPDFAKTHPHVDLANGFIEQRDKFGNLLGEVHCPLACNDAVVAYALDVMAWCRKSYKALVRFDPVEGGRAWHYAVHGGLKSTVGTVDSKLAAAEALILAVAGEVGR